MTKRGLFEPPAGTVYENECEVTPHVVECVVRFKVSMMVGGRFAGDEVAFDDASSPSIDDVK
jgi:hypothetical protein